MKKPVVSTKQINDFRSRVWHYYRKHGRDLPWRHTRDPYKILVSEIMLQQTQVDRVVGKYRRFIKTFPDVRALAVAPLARVFTVWQGLGYNRRALSLHRLAKTVITLYSGRIPDEPYLLRQLPGIGEATANSICAFAFNKPVVFIETNIRSVFIHHFFKDSSGIKDEQIMPLLVRTLVSRRSRDWHSALMDYGTLLKKKHTNPGRKSAHHNVQSRFEGSDRQLRGAIVRLLVENKRITLSLLYKRLNRDRIRMRKVVDALIREGLVKKRGASFYI